MQRFIGQVTLRTGESYGFIARSSITKDNGTAHGLQTSKDVYVHQEDCGSVLRDGVTLTFEVVSDTQRGGDALRAVDVSEVFTRQLVPAGAHSASTALTDPRSLYVSPTPIQTARMKRVDPDAVTKVTANRPMPSVPRDGGQSDMSAAEITRRMLEGIFADVPYFNEGDVTIDSPDSDIDSFLQELEEHHRKLRMAGQFAAIKEKILHFKDVRNTLSNALAMASAEGLLRPDLMIPVKYLPDIFSAVPVWYFLSDADPSAREKDPEVHRNVRFMCDLVPSQRWYDTLLMFNRRMRTLADYRGDSIPLKVLKRIEKMKPLFDHIVIMTPYHDVAGQDWSNLDWLRSIDPYVVGFKKGVPFFFILARFSDSGVFPLFNELVADTMTFLRVNIDKLAGFNTINNPYWYYGSKKGSLGNRPKMGTHLQGHTREMLNAFEAGTLFDWLRGEEGQLPTRA